MTLKKNYFFAALAGFITGIIFIPIFKNLGINIPYRELVLVIFWPAFFIFGVFVGKLISRKLLWFWQLTKFAEVGFLNTAIDFGVLNLLIFFTGIPSGIYFSFFKAASFAVANINSYFWNRFWVFEAKETPSSKEYAQFLVVSLVAIGINVGVASLVVNFIPIQFGLSSVVWANIGAAVGVGSGLIWNFLGYKFVVFKNNNMKD